LEGETQEMKLTKTVKGIPIFVIVLCLVSAGVAYGLAGVWSGTVTIPSPLPLPTDTFTVTATLNGTAVSNPTAITLPSTFHVGDSFVIIYSIASTANQAIVITPTATPSTGITATWSPSTLALSVGDSGTLTLTIPNITTGGNIAVSFTPITS
jgi:hypothetical protein